MNLSEFRKNKYGDAQKSEQTTFIGAVTGAKGDALKEVHESAQKQVEARKKASASPAWTERVGKTVTGAGKGSAAGFTNLGGVVVEGMNKVGTYLQSRKDAQQAVQDREYLAKYEQDLKDAIAAGDAKAEKTARGRINAAKNRLKTNGDMTEYYKSVGDTTVKNIYDTADDLAESSQRDISRAKQGAGKVGQFAVDVGVAGTQMAGDIGLALLTGGSALAPMAARSFGSSSQEARQSGATYGQQVAYGAGSAALSWATEKIANVAAPFKSMFGEGLAEKAAGKLIARFGESGAVQVMRRLANTAGGKAVLSAISEGGEEMLEDLVQPILQRATYDTEAMAHYKDTDYWANTLYDGLVGGALGGIGSGFEQAGNRVRKNASAQNTTAVRNGTVQAAGTQAAQTDGNSMGAQESGVEGVSGGIMEQEVQRLFGQQKAASHGETAGMLKADTSLFNEVDDIKIEPPTRTSTEVVQPEKTGGSSMDLTQTEGRLAGPAPVPFSAVSGPVEGTRPLDSDITIPQGADSVKFGTDGLGAADAGFTTRGMEGQERTSRLADSMPYDQYAEAATGMSREDYAKLFRYQSQTEGKSLHTAEELLYFRQDGQRRFLLDVDPNAFSELVESLDAATAWNGPQTDAARMIETELKGRSVNMEIPETEYIHWLEIMREHTTSTGQGIQANAKWSRNDNPGGMATELEAWKNLKDSGLSDAEKQKTFSKIVQWDMKIDGVQEGDTAALKDIILCVGQERGVLNALTGKQSKRLTDRASKALDSLTFDQLKEFAYSSTVAMSSDSTPANIGQKIKTIQILNMLSSPKTTAKNLTGNTSFYGIDAVAMDGAAILDMAVSKLTGTRSVAFERAAIGRASLGDAAKAMQMSIAEITLDVDMGGEKTRYGTGSSRTFKASGRNFIGKVLSMLERNQSYLLTATDEFYKGAARGTEKATQSLIDQGKIKTTDKEYAAKQADQLAKYRTFQDDTKISVAIQQIHDILNLAGVGDSGKTIKGQTVHAFGAGDIVAPFTRVAGNLVSRGLEYSPVNAVKGLLEIVQQVAKTAGGQNVDPAAQAKGVSDLARGMTGTAIAYGFMLLARSGLLRQAEDEADEDVAALNQSEGMTGTQLNLTATQRVLSRGSAEWKAGDTLVDLSSIEPLNLLMNLGTEMAKSPENPIVSSFKSTLDSFGDASAELPVLQSIGEFGKDVFVYGGDWKESAVEQAGKTLVSSVTPNVVSALAKGLDDRPRNVYTGDSLADIIVDSLKNRAPVLRETLPGSVNTMGEEKTYQGGKVDNLVNALISPVGVNTYTQSDVSKEMQSVRESTGDATFYPTKRIPSELEYTDGDGRKHVESLSYEERQAFQRDRGAYTMTTYADVTGTSAYKNAGDEQKAELLNLAGEYAYQLAKANVLGEDAVDQWVLNARNARKDIGVSTGEYLALYKKYGSSVMSGEGYEKTKQAIAAGLSVDEYAAMRKGLDADGNGGVSQKEAQAYLDGQGFTTGQKADLWTIINKSWKKNPYQ